MKRIFNSTLDYFSRLLNKNDPADLRLFMTLAVLVHYILGSFVALFAKSVLANTELIGKYVDYDFVILVVAILGWKVEDAIRAKGVSNFWKKPDIHVDQADNINLTKKDEEPQDI